MAMDSRRNFLGKMATGLAAVAAPGSVLGANDRLRVGIIGIGDRGTEITRWAMSCPNIDFMAFSDIYTERLEKAKLLRSEEHTSELQSPDHLVCRLLLEKKKMHMLRTTY